MVSVESGFKLRSLQLQAPSPSPLSRLEKLNDLSQITQLLRDRIESLKPGAPPTPGHTWVTHKHVTTCDMYRACCCFCLQIQIPFQKQPLSRATSLPVPMDALCLHRFPIAFFSWPPQRPATQSDRSPSSPREEHSGSCGFSNTDKWR